MGSESILLPGHLVSKSLHLPGLTVCESLLLLGHLVSEKYTEPYMWPASRGAYRADKTNNYI